MSVPCSTIASHDENLTNQNLTNRNRSARKSTVHQKAESRPGDAEHVLSALLPTIERAARRAVDRFAGAMRADTDQWIDRDGRAASNDASVIAEMTAVGVMVAAMAPTREAREELGSMIAADVAAELAGSYALPYRWGTDAGDPRIHARRVVRDARRVAPEIIPSGDAGHVRAAVRVLAYRAAHKRARLLADRAAVGRVDDLSTVVDRQASADAEREHGRTLAAAAANAVMDLPTAHLMTAAELSHAVTVVATASETGARLVTAADVADALGERRPVTVRSHCKRVADRLDRGALPVWLVSLAEHRTGHAGEAAVRALHALAADADRERAEQDIPTATLMEERSRARTGPIGPRGNVTAWIAAAGSDAWDARADWAEKSI